MSFPDKLLAPGEEVVTESGPHWSLLVPRVLASVLVIAGCVAALLLWSAAPLFVGWALLGIGLVAIAAVVAKVVSWRATELVITTRRVIYRTGVLHRLGREIPLGRIQDVTYRQSLLERILGAGSLTVESAGERGQEPFPDIRRPASVQSLINQLISGPSPWTSPAPLPSVVDRGVAERRPRGGPVREAPAARPTRFVRSEPTTTQVPTSSPADGQAALSGRRSVEEPDPSTTPSESIEMARLDELHRLGILTDSEYEHQRRQRRQMGGT